MPLDLEWLSEIDPVWGLIIVFVMGVSFAIIVWLRLNFHSRKVEVLEQQRSETNERVAVNETHIKWLRTLVRKKRD